MLLGLSLLAFLLSVPQFSGPGLSKPARDAGAICQGLPYKGKTCANISADSEQPIAKSQKRTADSQKPIAGEFAGFDIPIYTGAITSFTTATDSKERIWVALATPEGEISLYFSSDQGTSWHQSFSILLNREIPRIEMVTGNEDPSPAYVFYLTPENSGDLWVLRVSETSWDTLPVAVGPDTIDDFSVTVDKDTNYYLYCLYVNEHRPGRNGSFLRSFNRGLTWEMPQDFWN
ncbi:MAG: hypothetical protein ABIK18_03655, partial [candidate division WOR-3 bacterium]